LINTTLAAISSKTEFKIQDKTMLLHLIHA